MCSLQNTGRKVWRVTKSSSGGDAQRGGGGEVNVDQTLETNRSFIATPPSLQGKLGS